MSAVICSSDIREELTASVFSVEFQVNQERRKSRWYVDFSTLKMKSIYSSGTLWFLRTKLYYNQEDIYTAVRISYPKWLKNISEKDADEKFGEKFIMRSFINCTVNQIRTKCSAPSTRGRDFGQHFRGRTISSDLYYVKCILKEQNVRVWLETEAGASNGRLCTQKTAPQMLHTKFLWTSVLKGVLERAHIFVHVFRYIKVR
jgi:hypothetical protein